MFVRANFKHYLIVLGPCPDLPKTVDEPRVRVDRLLNSVQPQPVALEIGRNGDRRFGVHLRSQMKLILIKLILILFATLLNTREYID
jgi:hypothetical protein